MSYEISPDDSLHALRSVPLFSGLDEDALMMAATAVLFRKGPAGLPVIEEGSQGDALYVLLSGAASVTRSSSSGETVELAHLSAGDHFGEMSLIDEEPRSATVTLVEDSEMMVLDKQNFEQLLALEPAVMRSVLGGLARRLRETNERMTNT